MMNEEAIEYLKNFKDDQSWDGMPEEVIDMAIKALSQEPNKYWIDKDNKIYKMPDDIPQKSGKWIEHKNNGMDYIECPKCSSWFLRMYLTRNSYCPNCGAKM